MNGIRVLEGRSDFGLSIHDFGPPFKLDVPVKFIMHIPKDDQAKHHQWMLGLYFERAKIEMLQVRP